MKKILTILILLQFIYAASNAQIKLIGNITTNGKASYPTHIDSLGKGGMMVMPTIGSRDSIPSLRRKKGMLVYVQKVDILYKLNTDNTKKVTDSSDWLSIGLNSTADVDRFLKYAKTSDSLFIIGNTRIDSNLIVGKDLEVKGNLILNTGLKFNDSLIVTKGARIDSSLILKGKLLLRDSLVAGGNGLIKGKVQLDSTLTVNKVTTLRDSFNVKGRTQLDSTLYVNKVTSLNDSLFVKGKVTLDSSLYVKNKVTIGDSLVVKGFTKFYNHLSIDAAYTFPTGIVVGASGLRNDGRNTAVGFSVLNNNIGFWDEAFGNSSLSNNTSGTFNSAYGGRSLFSNISGNGNVSFGFQSLYNNLADSNAAFGYNAGFKNTTGTKNTFIGWSADADSVNLTNATAIGAGAIVKNSNTLQLGNTLLNLVNTSGSINSSKTIFANKLLAYDSLIVKGNYSKIDSNLIIGKDLYVGGKLTVGSGLEFKDSLLVSRGARIDSSLLLKGNLNVAGVSILNDSLIVKNISILSKIQNDSIAITTKLRSDSTDITSKLRGDSTAITTKLRSDSTDLRAKILLDSSTITTKLRGDSTAITTKLRSDSTDITSKLRGDSTAITTKLRSDSSDLRAKILLDSSAITTKLRGDSTLITTKLRSDSTDLTSKLKAKILIDSNAITTKLRVDSTAITAKLRSDSTVLHGLIKDTANLLNARINLKVNIADTAVMLDNYRNSINDLGSTKVNKADTAAMLNSRFARDTVSISNRIDVLANSTSSEKIKFTKDFPVRIAAGKTFGKYTSGSTVPATGKTLDELLTDITTEVVHPTYTRPSVSISATPAAGIFEIGSNISVSLASSFTRNDGGAATATTYQNGSGALGGNTDNISNITSPKTYSVVVDYAHGAPKNNNLSLVDSIGIITPGSVNSSLTFTPKSKKYWGASASAIPTDAEILASAAGSSPWFDSRVATFFIDIATLNTSTGSTTSKFVYYAYPVVSLPGGSDNGEIIKITVAGFESTKTFSWSKRTIVNAQGYSAEYYIYVSNNDFLSKTPEIIIY
jgi:predicted acyltransferase (DUF342 family)